MQTEKYFIRVKDTLKEHFKDTLKEHFKDYTFICTMETHVIDIHILFVFSLSVTLFYKVSLDRSCTTDD